MTGDIRSEYFPNFTFSRCTVVFIVSVVAMALPTPHALLDIRHYNAWPLHENRFYEFGAICGTFNHIPKPFQEIHKQGANGLSSSARRIFILPPRLSLSSSGRRFRGVPGTGRWPPYDPPCCARTTPPAPPRRPSPPTPARR